MRGLELVLHLLQLLRPDRTVAQLLQLAADCLFRLLQRDSGRRLPPDVEQPGIARARDVGVERGEKLPLLHQPADKPAGTPVAQDVGKDVVRIVVGIAPAPRMECHVEGIQRHVTLHHEAAFLPLLLLLGQSAQGHFAPGKRSEPLLRQAHGFRPRDVAGDGKHGVVRRVVAEEERLHLVKRGVGDVRQLLADGGPAVRVYLVRQRAEQMPHIAVRLVQAALLELLHHHAALHLQALLAERQLHHPVRLQPESGLDVRLGHGEVVVGDVVVGPRVALPSRPLQGGVVVGDVRRASEHQVLEEVGETGVVGMLVAGADIIDDVQGDHLRAAVLVVYQAQTVGKGMLVYFHIHRVKGVFGS